MQGVFQVGSKLQLMVSSSLLALKKPLMCSKFRSACFSLHCQLLHSASSADGVI